MMDKKLAWRLTAKGRATQELLFSGKVAGKNIADTEASKQRPVLGGAGARVANRQPAIPRYTRGSGPS